MPQASRVEDEIKSVYSDANISFVKTFNGEFIVQINGKILFEKSNKLGIEEVRFPYEGEILELIKNKL